MPLDEKLRKCLERALDCGRARAGSPSSLVADARRRWARLCAWIAQGLIHPDADLDALELATLAIQLPLRQPLSSETGIAIRTNLRQRAEQAAEMLLEEIPEKTDDATSILLDRVTLLLHELPQRRPNREEARLLADAVNLEDFGLVGLLQQATQIARQGGGIAQIADGLKKREAYGYWDSRLKDGFHFETIRKLAAQRLEHLRTAAALLNGELAENSGA